MGLERVIYPLMCTRSGRQRIYVKIWIDNLPFHGNIYADGAMVAWRSGCCTTEPDLLHVGSGYGQEDIAKLERQFWRLKAEFCGAYEPNLIYLTPLERRLVNFFDGEGSIAQYVKRAELIARWWTYGMSIGEAKQMKLFFKTTGPTDMRNAVRLLPTASTMMDHHLTQSTAS